MLDLAVNYYYSGIWIKVQITENKILLDCLKVGNEKRVKFETILLPKPFRANAIKLFFLLPTVLKNKLTCSFWVKKKIFKVDL
jgi:hypothetical protein